MKIVSKLFEGLDWFIEKLCVFLMAFLALSVIVTVFLRYVLNISFIWAEEMIIFIFIATTYFGIIMCVKEDEHIAIDFFINLCSPIVKKIVETLISIVGIVTLLWLAKTSLGWISVVGNTLSPGMKVAYKVVYIWMPISFVLSAIYEVRKCVDKWRGVELEESISELEIACSEIEITDSVDGKKFDKIEEAGLWK